MDNLMMFRNGNTILPIKEVDGEIYFSAEYAAIGLGLCEIKNGKEYVIWKRVKNIFRQKCRKAIISVNRTSTL
ncbi:hypothetical protein [Ligilactobacillus agilis]|uniref:hypothetical protein n=1 Tax=Ligilactobacillus agilis TaxID=1601 RepID=UPI001A9262FD|nr:hypothetical protein [Ligilactobacillus agilis]